jgi:serine protease AprX
MKKLLMILALCVTALAVHAQYSRHIIQLRYKNGAGYSLKQPGAYLSKRALDRRMKSRAEVDSTDLPVSRAYLDSIRLAGNVRIISASKWLNQVLIQTTDAAALSRINNFPFVRKTQPVANRLNSNLVYSDKFKVEEHLTETSTAGQANATGDVYSYGQSARQVRIHNGDFLHNMGFDGKGIIIAVLDAGYFNYQSIKAFDSLRANKQILGVWDYVASEESVNEDHPHGTYCFSIMAANEPGRYVGTAPKASYYLFRTEDAATEYPVEEHNWVVAAERADSAGADMISSSLGYYLFDDPTFNYTYADMNGDRAMITIGADLAARKGMIVCNSAGNEGGSPWKYIIAPADGDSVLAIGAVNVDSIPGGFSSYGPSSDGRVKPDVASVGVNTWVIATNGNLAYGSGTSFSNPNLAGLIACLWQAFPEFSNMEILDAVKKSAHTYANPDTRMGYGIPDMKKAYESLQQKRLDRLFRTNWVKVYPNPVTDRANIAIMAMETGTLQAQLTDMSGRMLRTWAIPVQQGQAYTIQWDNASQFPRGAYNIRVVNGKSSTTVRLVR